MLALVTTELHVLFRHTSLGRAMRAAAGNGRAALLYGIDPRLMPTLSYGIAGVSGPLPGRS